MVGILDIISRVGGFLNPSFNSAAGFNLPASNTTIYQPNLPYQPGSLTPFYGNQFFGNQNYYYYYMLLALWRARLGQQPGMQWSQTLPQVPGYQPVPANIAQTLLQAGQYWAGPAVDPAILAQYGYKEIELSPGQPPPGTSVPQVQGRGIQNLSTGEIYRVSNSIYGPVFVRTSNGTTGTNVLPPELANGILVQYPQTLDSIMTSLGYTKEIRTVGEGGPLALPMAQTVYTKGGRSFRADGPAFQIQIFPPPPTFYRFTEVTNTPSSGLPPVLQQQVGLAPAQAEINLRAAGYEKILLAIPTGGVGGSVGILGGPEFAYRVPGADGRLFTVQTDMNGKVASFTQTQARPAYENQDAQLVIFQLQSQGYTRLDNGAYPYRYRSADGTTVLTINTRDAGMGIPRSVVTYISVAPASSGPGSPSLESQLANKSYSQAGTIMAQNGYAFVLSQSTVNPNAQYFLPPNGQMTFQNASEKVTLTVVNGSVQANAIIRTPINGTAFDPQSLVGKSSAEYEPLLTAAGFRHKIEGDIAYPNIYVHNDGRTITLTLGADNRVASVNVTQGTGTSNVDSLVNQPAQTAFQYLTGIYGYRFLNRDSAGRYIFEHRNAAGQVDDTIQVTIGMLNFIWGSQGGLVVTNITHSAPVTTGGTIPTASFPTAQAAVQALWEATGRNLRLTYDPVVIHDGVTPERTGYYTNTVTGLHYIIQPQTTGSTTVYVIKPHTPSASI